MNKNKPKREFITNVKVEPFARYCTIFKHAKKNQKSFRLTQSLLKSTWARAKKALKFPEIILTIPANEKENFIITCHVDKQRKV